MKPAEPAIITQADLQEMHAGLDQQLLARGLLGAWRCDKCGQEVEGATEAHQCKPTCSACNGTRTVMVDSGGSLPDGSFVDVPSPCPLCCTTEAERMGIPFNRLGVEPEGY